jgi:hypothetical protein
VKIDQPRGEYYGGLTAAPVTRETLQGILAAHASALDGRSLLATRLASPLPRAARGAAAATPQVDPEGTYVFLTDDPPVPAAPDPAGPSVLPDLAGMTMRDAVRRLHAAGLRVRLSGGGRVERTEPAAGTPRAAGDTVLLVGSGR